MKEVSIELGKRVLVRFCLVLATTVCGAGSFAAAEPPIEVRVRQTVGGPAIHVDGRIVAPQFFYGIPTYEKPMAESPFYRTVAHCRDAGVRFLSFPAAVCWHPPDAKDDWRSIDYLFEQILSVHPDALLVPRIPVNAPEWLRKKHPEWKMKLLDSKGQYYTSEHASVFAHEYRAMAAAHIEKLVRHLRAKFPRNFAGIHPVGQSFGEFFYIDSLGLSLHSFEDPVRDEWRKWLVERGEADAATAEIPTPEERRRRIDGFLRDPLADRRVVEFSDFEQCELADFVAEMAAAARRGGDGKTLVMVFSGYVFEHVSAPNGAAAAGGYGAQRLLDKAAGNIDLLCAPFSYVNRRYLAPTMTQTAAESAVLRGVMCLDEDDTRTYLVAKTNFLELAGNWVRTTKKECLRQLRSNLYSCMTRGRAYWWMDLIGDGWYDDRDLWNVMEEMRPLELEIANVRKGPFAPEIAILLDERGMLFAAAESRPAFDPLIRFGRLHFETCGAPYGQYFATDALAGKVPAKLQFFTSTFFTDEAVRRAIAAQRGMQPGVTRVWCWAPGYISDVGRSDGNIVLATGFRAKRIAAAVPRVTATPAGKALGFPDRWEGPHEVDPLFSVEATDSETLARWPDGSPAVAVRKSGVGHEVFMGIPAFTPEVVAAFARLAGCSLYAKPGEAYVRVADDRVFITKLSERLPLQKKLIAHAGKGNGAPENTLPAFKAAVATGFGFECDIQMSADHRIFAAHNPSAKAYGGGDVPFKTMQWSEIEKLDVGRKLGGVRWAGTPPPLFEDILKLMRDGRKSFVEVKGSAGTEIVPYIKKAVESQSNATPENMAFISFDREICRALRKALPKYEALWIILPRKDLERFGDCKGPAYTAEEVIALLKDANLTGVDMCGDMSVATEDFIKKVKAAGFKFGVWTVDDTDVARIFLERGVDAVTTNRSKEIAEELKDWKWPAGVL